VKTVVRALTIAVAASCAAAGGVSASGASGPAPLRVDDANSAPVEASTWVSHVLRGSPRVDDFNAAPAAATWVSDVGRGSPRVDDFDATPTG
jgi:hypothetical protein